MIGAIDKVGTSFKQRLSLEDSGAKYRLTGTGTISATVVLKTWDGTTLQTTTVSGTDRAEASIRFFTTFRDLEWSVSAISGTCASLEVYRSRKQAITAGAQGHPPPTMCILGTSIEENNGGPGSLNPEQYNNYGYFVWMNFRLKGRMQLLYNAGVSGSSVAEMLTRLPTITSLSPGYCIVGAPTNDIATFATPIATIISTYKEIIDTLTDNGTYVIMMPCLPRDTIDSAAELLTKSRFNKWQSWYSTQRKNLAFVNSHRLMTAFATGLQVSGYLRDNIHYAPKAGYVVGTALAQALSPHFPIRDYYGDDIGDTDNIITGSTVPGYDLGAAGDSTSNTSVTAITGFTGTLAAGFTATREAGSTGTTAVWNDQATGSDGRTDWQEIEVTACDNAAAVIRLNKSGNITTGWSVGDIIQASVEVDVVSCVDTRAINLRLTFTSGTPDCNAMQENNASDGATITTSESFIGVLTTPEYRIPTGATAIQWRIRLAAQSTSWVGKFRFRRGQLRNITVGGY